MCLLCTLHNWQLQAGAAFLPVDNAVDSDEVPQVGHHATSLGQDAPLARKQFLLHESEAAALIAVSGRLLLLLLWTSQNALHQEMM